MLVAYAISHFSLKEVFSTMHFYEFFFSENLQEVMANNVAIRVKSSGRNRCEFINIIHDDEHLFT